jgi:nicotinate-nucleotide adenylyltransferase
VNWIKPPSPLSRGLRIGLLGGSFNPPHHGHLHISLMALKRLKLDYVWWLVTPKNPLKGYAGLAPLRNRLQQAYDIARHPRIIPLDIERMLGTRYSIDTLTALKRRFPEVQFVWLMGSDNLAQFHRWRRWQDIARLVPIAVMARPNSVMRGLSSKAKRRFPRQIRFLDGPRDPQSSTAIRAKLAGSDTFVRLTPLW